MINDVVNKICLRLFDTVDENTLRLFTKEITLVLNDYDIAPKETTLSVYHYEDQIVQMYVVALKIGGLSKNTLKNYYLRLTQFFDTVRKAPDKVTTSDIRAYLYKYQSEKKVKNITMEQIRLVLSAFFEWTVSEGYLSSNPAKPIKAIKFEKKLKPYLTQLQIEGVLGKCKTIRERAMILTLYTTGIRVSEISQVKISDIDFDNKTMLIHGKGNKERKVLFNARCLVTIKEYLDCRPYKSPYLFCSTRGEHLPLHNCGIEKILRNIGMRVDGLPNNGNLTPHMLRRSMATNSGLDLQVVSTLLGHSSTLVTERYRQLSDNRISDAYRASNF